MKRILRKHFTDRSPSLGFICRSNEYIASAGHFSELIWSRDSDIKRQRIKGTQNETHFSFLISHFLFLVGANSVWAQECIEANSSDKPDITTKRVHIYVESDMASEMASAGGVPSNLQFRQIRTAVMQAADAWNTSTRAVSLVYKGTSNLTPLGFCNSSLGNAGSDFSVLFVHFGDGISGSAMTVRTITGCTKPNVNELIVREKTSNNNTRNYPSGSNGASLGNFLVHEMGHVVGLGHFKGATSLDTCYSVMNSHAATNNAICATNNIANGGRFPIRTDKDCAKLSSITGSPGKELKIHAKTWNSVGVSKTLGPISSTTTRQRSFQGRSVTTSGSRRYSLYADNKMMTAGVGSDGYLSFSTNTISSGHSELFSLDDSPTVFRLVEFTASSEPMRFIFLDDDFDGSGATADPPYVQFYRTNHNASGTPLSSDISYYVCFNYPCTSTSALRNHIAPVLTYDPVSGRTVQVTVRTQSLDSNDGDGDIRVHAGLKTGSLSTLTFPYSVGSLTAPNSPISNWQYRNKTEVKPAVACADLNYSLYNCVLAWNESGAHDGRILYVYFRVYPGTDYVIFDPVGVRTFFSYLETHTGPTVSYFADKLWLAVAEYDSDIQIFTSTSPGSWGFSSSIVGDDIVGPASFAVHENNETALVYAVSE